MRGSTSRARLPDEPHDLAGQHLQVDAVQSGQARPLEVVADFESFDREKRAAHALTFPGRIGGASGGWRPRRQASDQ